MHPNFFLIFSENFSLLSRNIIKLVSFWASNSKYKKSVQKVYYPNHESNKHFLFSFFSALFIPSLIQVDNFLQGKQPLTLALRLGNHMVFVQLQLAGTPGHQHPQNMVNTATQTCQGGSQRLHGGANGNGSTTGTMPPRSATPPCIVRMPSQPVSTVIYVMWNADRATG